MRPKIWCDRKSWKIWHFEVELNRDKFFCPLILKLQPVQFSCLSGEARYDDSTRGHWAVMRAPKGEVDVQDRSDIQAPGDVDVFFNHTR